MPSMTEKLAARLVRGRAPTVFLEPMRACVAVAGGGSGAAAAVASTPGASSILLESIVTYDRKSFADFVSRNIERNEVDRAWLTNLEGGCDDLNKFSRSSGDWYERDSTSFQFCSAQAAVMLSRSALRRSLQLTPSFQDRSLHCIGVGCTSSLVGDLSPEGEEIGRRKGRKSRAYIACSTLREGAWAWEVELEGRSLPMKGARPVVRRSRSQEESLVSNLILLLMVHHRERLHGPLTGDCSFATILDREGDTISEMKLGDIGSRGRSGDRNSAAFGASQIINGAANAFAILPVPHGNGQGVTQMEALFSDRDIPCPRDLLIVPGSFNPPHQGHIGLANAAVSALRRLRQEERERERQRVISSISSSLSSSSSVLKNLWNSVDQCSDEQHHPTVLFEMSVTNVDKPPLDPSEARRRVELFATSLPTSEMPRDWAVVLTNAPLFLQKTNILDKLVGLENEDRSGDGSFGPFSSANDCQTANVRRMSFVIGTDTMVRLINPKYYENSRENMDDALTDMQERGVHFIVGGRLRQGTRSGPSFVNGEEELKSLPPNIQQMFTLLAEDEFRLDISSTELRRVLDK